MEGIYLLELSNGSIKVGRSAKLADRLRAHAAWIAAASLYVVQSWTCSVQNSEQAEDQILAVFEQLPGVRLVAGRETFTGIAFFVAITLARDVCLHYSVSVDAAPEERPVHPVLGAMVNIMDELGVDRIRTQDLLPRLSERVSEIRCDDFAKAAQQLAYITRSYGVQGVRWRPQEGGNPVRGYFRADIAAALKRISVQAWPALASPGQAQVRPWPGS